MAFGWYREQGMSEKIFAEGAYWNAPPETAPKFVVGRIGIQRDRFMEWLAKQPVSEKGYLSLDVTERRNAPGEYSVALNTWKPTGQSKPAQPDFDDSAEIPF
jgi:hypothetical protein